MEAILNLLSLAVCEADKIRKAWRRDMVRISFILGFVGGALGILLLHAI